MGLSSHLYNSQYFPSISKETMNKYLSLRIITASLLVLVIGVGFWGSGIYSANAEQATLPLKELRTFSDVYGRIKTSYVDEIDDATLIEGAIDGMLAKLDPYSVFLKKKSYEELKVNTTGKFGGLGIEVDKEGGFVHVIAPIDDTPAERAGIQAGDLISEINNKSTKGLSLQEAVEQMRGEVGTTITLTILRKKEKEPDQEATLYKKLSSPAPSTWRAQLSRFKTLATRYSNPISVMCVFLNSSNAPV